MLGINRLHGIYLSGQITHVICRCNVPFALLGFFRQCLQNFCKHCLKIEAQEGKTLQLFCQKMICVICPDKIIIDISQLTVILIVSLDFTVQDSLLWPQWCPYYGGFTVQDSLLWSQWCPLYRGFTVHTHNEGADHAYMCAWFK